MKPIDILIILVIAVIIGVAIAYIVRAKKKGAKCIGCRPETAAPHGNMRTRQEQRAMAAAAAADPNNDMTG